jgi:hypothetical protein
LNAAVKISPKPFARLVGDLLHLVRRDLRARDASLAVHVLQPVLRERDLGRSIMTFLYAVKSVARGAGRPGRAARDLTFLRSAISGGNCASAGPQSHRALPGSPRAGRRFMVMPSRSVREQLFVERDSSSAITFATFGRAEDGFYHVACSS